MGIFFNYNAEDSSDNNDIADSLLSVSNDATGAICPDAVASNSSARSEELEKLFNSILQASAGPTSTPKNR